MTTTSTIKAFNFEVYTKNPLTGEEGWDIMFPTVYAESKEAAKAFLKSDYPNFDCIILFNYGCEIKDGSIDQMVYATGASYRDTTYEDRYN